MLVVARTELDTGVWPVVLVTSGDGCDTRISTRHEVSVAESSAGLSALSRSTFISSLQEQMAVACGYTSLGKSLTIFCRFGLWANNTADRNLFRPPFAPQEEWYRSQIIGSKKRL